MPKRHDSGGVPLESGKEETLKQIIQSVQGGSMKPRAADSIILERGIELDASSTLDDPTAKSDWHLSLAVIFYAWQDIALVRSEWKRFERWSHYLWQDDFDPRQIMDLTTAEQALKHDLISGKVRSAGYIGSSDKLSFHEVAILASEWNSLVFWKSRTFNQHMWGASESGDVAKYAPVTVLRSDVVSLWLSEETSVSASTKRERLVVDQSAPKRAGGAPERYDWEGMWIEIVRLARDGELPPRAKLPDQLASWFLNTTGEEPGLSTIRAKVKRLFDSIGIE